MSRIALPQRRRCVTKAATWNAPDGSAHTFTVSVGLDDQGMPREAFCDHAKGAMQATLSDVCTLISIALQHNITPQALAKSLGRVPLWGGEASASPVGTIIEAIMGEAE